MNESSELATLFLDLLTSWTKIGISVLIAILVRYRAISATLAMVAGALEGLVGSKLELLDIYLSRSGWESIDLLTLTAVALSALGSLLWWSLARAVCTLVRRFV
jgi:ABC-type microcin C transport system permease subunit YejE